MKIYGWIFAGIILGTFLYSLSAIFMPFIAGMIGAYMLNPLVLRLQHKGLHRVMATTVAMIAAIAIIAIFLMVIIPYMHHELVLISRELPVFTEKLFREATPLIEKFSKDFGTPTVDQLKIQMTSHIGDIVSVVINFLIRVLSSGMMLANLISLLVLTPVVMFYFLKDWPDFLGGIDLLIPRQFHKMVKRYALTIHKTLGEYAKGQVIVCITLIFLYALGLFLIKLPNAFFIAFVAGFLAFVPYLGWLLGFALSIIVTFIHFQGMWQIGAVVVVFSFIGLLEGNVLTPRFIGKKVGVHPVGIIFALLAFGHWFGFMGVVIALPVTAMISAIFRLVMEEYFKSAFYLGKTEFSLPKSK